MIYQGDCISVMKTLPAKSVNCCVTSPPYFGLRDYAVIGQIGLEETPEKYVEKLVDVFSEVWRVLKDDGTLWLNLGDCYFGSGKGQTINGCNDKKQPKLKGMKLSVNREHFSLKAKDLIGIPWRVAFALQANGWYLRQDIIWHKPNPMPESVKDRCTKSHEYIFLMSKNSKYYFDSEAVKEKGVIPAGTKGAKGSKERQNQFGVNARPPEYKIYDGMRNKRSVWTVTTKPFKEAHFATFPPDLIKPCILAGCPKDGIVLDPFNGAGTTSLVSVQNGRNYIGIEIKPEYIKIAQNRINQADNLFVKAM